MTVESVDVLAQTITLKPSRRAGRKRGKTGTRMKRGKGFKKGNRYKNR